MRRALLAALLSAAVVLPLFAAAHHAALRDGNDARGKLDVRRVSVAGKLRRPRWIVATFDRWRVRQIYDRGFVLVYFDTFASRRYDYYVVVRGVGSRLVAELFRDRKDQPDVRVSGLPVGRPNRRSVAVRVPLRKMRFGRRRLHYYWYVQTLFTSSRCPRVCFDRAPDRGGVLEPLVREPTPSPSPTASPTSLPTAMPSPSPTSTLIATPSPTLSRP